MLATWLADFMELARTRSFTRAAENRNVTHPAFGRRIKALEEWAGVPLIHRTVPIDFTAEGIIVLETATEIIETLRLLRERLDSSDKTGEPDLKIATGVTISSTFFPQWLKEVSAIIGNFSTRIIAGNHEKAIGALANLDADILIAYSSYHTRLKLNPAQYDWIIIATEELVPISAIGENGKPLFTGSESSSTPYIGFTTTTALHPIITRHLSSLKNKPNVKMVHETDSYSSVLELVAAGIGMAWLPLRLVRPSLDAKRIMLIDQPSWQAKLDIALYRRKLFSHKIVNQLWENYSLHKID
ncbi:MULTISPECIES: LysR family transcriptional regulator [unclassified Bartonella]|uniref:LysR family transcriptional regulator n=1 Tax=unclassified Bartonella TaxID=2645622 RepID=UPI0015F7B3CC|nr:MULTISPECIES: LysR family transcriptional regulator [unclassified Bartonella]UXN07966.1 LysR family transcriptional regulator [Bartonella sp. HY761]